MGIKDQPTNLGPVYEPVGGKPTDPTPYNSHPEQPFGASGGAPTDPEPTNIHPLAANLGWIIGGLVDGISWLLSNALNLFATVPDDGTQDAVMAVGSDTTARVWDETTGLALATVSAGNPVSEGMRLATTVADGATPGSELITNVADREFTSDTGFWGKATGVTIGSGSANFLNATKFNGLSKTVFLEVGKRYSLTYTVKDWVTGTHQGLLGSGTSLTQHSGNGTWTEEGVCLTNESLVIRTNSDTSNFSVDDISIKEVLPTFLNDDGSGNKLTPSKVGSNGEEIMLVHEGRENNEAIVSPLKSYDVADGAVLGSEVFPDDETVPATTPDYAERITTQQYRAKRTAVGYGTLELATGLDINTDYKVTYTALANTWGEGLSDARHTLYGEPTHDFLTIGNQEFILKPNAQGKIYIGFASLDYGVDVHNISVKQITPATVITGNDNYRVTPSADPHNWFYEQQAMEELWTGSGAGTVQAGWTDNGDGSYTTEGTADYFFRNIETSFGEVTNLGQPYFDVEFTISDYSGAGSVDVVFFADGQRILGSSIPTTSDGIYKVRLYCGTTSANLGFDGNGTFIGTISNISITLAPKTSLTEPLRDSQGRYYEELVKNGGFDVDAEYVKSSGVTISGGVTAFSGVGSSTGLQQTMVGMVAGKTYEITYDVVTVSAGGFRALAADGGYLTTRNAVGTYTEAFTWPTTDQRLFIHAAGSTTGSIDNVSVVEVDANGNPTNVLDGGVRVETTNHLLNSDAPVTQTTASLPVGWYSLLTWGNTGSVAITAGTATIGAPTGSASEGVPAYFEVTGTGTVTVTITGAVDNFQLQGGIVKHEQTMFILTAGSTVTQSENVSESVLWSYGGRYNNIGAGHLTHVLNEPEATNVILQSRDLTTTWAASRGTPTSNLFTEDSTAANTHYITQIVPTLTLNTDYTLSVVAKPNGRDWVRLFARNEESIGRGVWFNIATGEVGTADPGMVGAIEPYLDGYLLSATFDSGASDVTVALVSIYLGEDGVASAYDGDGVSGAYLEDIQLEVGSVPTSRIPTTTGTVTRAATSFTVPNPIPTGNHAGRLRWLFSGTATADVDEYLFDDYKDASNGLFVYYNKGLGAMFVTHESEGVVKASAVTKPVTEGGIYNIGWLLEDGTINLFFDGDKDLTPATGVIARVPADNLKVGSRYTDTLQTNVTDLQVYTGSDLETWASDTEWSEAE